jgi:antiphage defense system Thoeris ThsB-like protein
MLCTHHRQNAQSGDHSSNRKRRMEIMARRVFFSFHWERDIWRANQVRNSWVTQGNETAGFVDHAAWETVKRGGDTGIKRWIDGQLEGTSVTVVLIGSQTYQREYVLYEIEESQDRGNGLLGIYIHHLKDSEGRSDTKGKNPFDEIAGNDSLFPWETLADEVRTYDWVTDNGYANLGDWVEAAAIDADR